MLLALLSLPLVPLIHLSGYLAATAVDCRDGLVVVTIQPSAMWRQMALWLIRRP